MDVEFMNYAMLRLGYVIEMSGLDTLRDKLLCYARRLTGFDRYTTMLLRLSLTERTTHSFINNSAVLKLSITVSPAMYCPMMNVLLQKRT